MQLNRRRAQKAIRIMRTLPAVLLVVTLGLPLSRGQAEAAVEGANKLLDFGVSRIKEALKPSRSRSRLATQSVDPARQSFLVHHFNLCPRKLLLYSGESFTLVPLALDRNKEVVEGAVFDWQSKDDNIADVSSTGEVTAVSPGHTQVEVRAGTAKGKVNVEVRSGSRKKYTDRKKADDDWEVEHGHDCDAPEDDPAPSQGINNEETTHHVAASLATRSGKRSEARINFDTPAAGPELLRGTVAPIRKASVFRLNTKPAALVSITSPYEPGAGANGGAEATHAMTQPLPQGPGGFLDGSSPDVTSIAAAAPSNAVGQPRFAPMEFSQGSAAKTRNNLGSYNYSFSAPVLGLGGRGIGVNLALTYNSRVWNKDDANTMTFNYQKGWPAPGWTLGYGRLIDNYDNTGSGDLSGVGQANAPGSYLLIQPDGTRIHLQQTYDPASGRWSHNSKDGSFITFNPLNGKLRYTDGTLVTFDLINNRRLPSSIRTNNGDTITVAYKTFVKNNPDPSLNFPFRWAIDYIYDSLGRYVRFNYDSTPRLVSITAKDKGGATDRVLCQIDYTDITLNYNFNSSITTVNAPASNSLITVVRRIYWPATGRGYLFPDYNSYGTARKVSMRIGMTASGDGTEAAYTRYDYPSVSTQVGGLNDSPQFTNRYEWWQNKIDGAAETVYTYSRSTDAVAGTEIDKVSYPNGIDMVTTSGNDQTGDPGDFGHVVKTEMKVGTNPPLRTSQQSYITDSSGGQQIGQVTATDEAGNIAKTTYDYYASYGRVQNVNEYGFSIAVQRKTTFFYSDDAGLLGLNMTGVVTEVRVFNGAGGLMAKTVNEIDNYTVNTLMDYGVTAPNHDYSGFGVTGTSRGNITKVTMSVLPGTATISRGFKYDVFGNVVRADVSCCQTKTTTFSSATWFSQPDSVTDGDPVQTPHLTTSFSYDFSTGLALSTTDPNGQTTSFDYDSAWRVKTINSATGASTLTQFDKDSNQNDLLSYFQRVTYLEADGITTRTITSRSWFDGAGRVLRAGTAAGSSPTSYDAVKTEYDAMGRVSRQSNPYTGDLNGNGSPTFWTANTYDSQSRVTTVTLPDAQTIQTEYNGAIVTVTDQVNRKRQSQVDGLGRLISVTEQDPATGVLSLATTYGYDTLDNLTSVNQGGQTRSFAYDSLGRMTSQSTPEGGAMSFAYTDFGALLKRTDARNVETHYHFDALNRLNQVWYTGVGGVDDPNASRPALPTGVAATSDVIIAYNTAAPGNGAVNRIDDDGGFETYVYDSLGRNTSKTRTIDGVNSYQTQYQYNQANQLALMIYPSGKRVRMNFDSRGRMIGEDKVDTTGSVLTSYLSGIGYDVAGQVTSMTSGSGVVESYTYSSNRLQLTRQTAVKGATTLMDLNYSYAAAAGASGAGTTTGNSGQLMAIGNNPSGQPSSINGQNRTQSFSYDDLGRLVTATGWSAWQRRFDYDRWGNRTGVWDATSGGNQIQSAILEHQAGAPAGVPSNRLTSVTNLGTTLPQTYDPSGNVTNDGTHTYQYDAEGRIATVDAAGATYSYDSANRRVKKVVGSTTTYYIWEGAQVIAEYSNAPAGSGGTSYYLADRLSTRMTTDRNGAFKGTQDHLPFGEDAATSGTTEKHRFTNYERDTESGSDYAINRQHQSSTGRFMRPDPVGSSIGNPQSLNRYIYAFADPVNLVDRLGLCTINVALNTNNLLTAAQQTAMQDEIRRIYGDAGHQVSFVSSPSNADYSLTVNGKSFDFTQAFGIAGITYRTGNLVSNSGRVFIDAINGSAGTATGYAQNSNNLGIGLGRAATHEMGHYLLQQAYDSMQIQGVMHAKFYGEQWFGLGTRNLWTFNTAQRLHLANKICITPEKTTLNDAPIQSRLIGEGVGGGTGIVGYPGWFFALFDFFDWLESIGEGTVSSSYELMPPDEAP